jgi:hypothetical protein
MAVGLLRLLPEGTSGVDLGLGTAIQIEDTERHFGATADTHPAVKRPASKLVGPLLLAGVLAAGAAVMLARSDDLSTASAAVLGSGLDRIGAIAEEAVANAPAAVIDLDAEPADEGSERTDATRPQPVRRSWPAPPRAPEPEPEPIAAPERASPPPPSGGKETGRGPW